MSNYLENKLWRHPSVFLTEDQLLHLLGGTADSCYGRIARAVKSGQLFRLKRGLYGLGERLAAKQPSRFEVAQLLYGPSYISLESALAYHGLIPEGVYSITSCCIKRNNEFTNSLGHFVYGKLPLDNFYLEVGHVESESEQFFIASPWKALLDYIYCRRNKWYNLEPVQESLRIDLEGLPQINLDTLKRLKDFYHRGSITRFIENIPQEYISEY